LVLDVVSAVAVQGMPTPDTGELLEDVRLMLAVTARALRHPVASQIIPDLLAEAARNPEIAEALRTALRDTMFAIAEAVVHAAVERGDLPDDTSLPLAVDLLAGPLYWRLAVFRSPVSGAELDQLAEATAAALAATGSAV
jgi:hypothetical protein